MAQKSVVIIPTYNERDNVVPMVNAIVSLQRYFDILFIDDQSPDGIESPGSRKDVTGWRIRLNEFGILINTGIISSANRFLNSSLFKLLTILCHLLARQLVVVI